MRARLVMSLLLIAGLLAPVAGSAHAAVPVSGAISAQSPGGAFTISIAEKGPFAPGTAVTVSMAGGPASQYVIVEQCGGDNTTCGSSATLTLDATGAGTTALSVHRRIGDPQHVIDCATAPCQVIARSLEGQSSASTPIHIDGNAPIIPPVLTVHGPSPLPDRANLPVSGRGFDPSTSIPLRECAGTDTTHCPARDVGYAYTDSGGNFDGTALVSRVIAGVDCAERPNRCRIWALPYGNIDHIVGVGLTFDSTKPPVFPQATVVPMTNLLHQQMVTVAGTHFFPSQFGQLEQCVEAGQPNERCRYLSNVSTSSSGAFTTKVAVARRVGLSDCAVAACVLRVYVYPADQIDVAISFDSSVAPPPVPAVAVNPHAGLLDRQVVGVEIRGADAGSDVFMRVCRADGSVCRGSVSKTVSDPVVVIPMALPRILAPTVDCAVVRCVVDVQLYGADSYEFKVPVGFDPSAPLAGSASIRVLPARGLWDRQRVEVRGERLDPGAGLSVQQCITATASSAACSAPQTMQVDSSGSLAGRFTVRRVLNLSDGAHDCVAVTCFLVVQGDPPTALALAFDANGPGSRSDLPPQLKCVAWPTHGWPTGALPAGVDKAAVEAVGAQMVGPNKGDSVVVIHGGRLVYEKYAEGVTANSVLPSFSVSKSFTSTMIGLLVDDGKLALDSRAPIKEWSAPTDPRRAITLRNILNMSSGLRWNEDYSDGNSDVFQMVAAADEAAYVIAKPLDAKPGSRWHYSTGDTAVLGRIIGDTANVSGDTYQAYLHKRLFDPLGINPVVAGVDKAGRWRAGWLTNTTTRNFAKLGLLYLRDGVWESRRFLSSNWVNFVRTPSPAYSGYGGQFWLDGDGSFRMIGLFGQTVHIIPELDLIVAINNGGSDFPMVDLFRNAEAPSCGAPGAVNDSASVRALGAVDINVLANDHGSDAGLAPATLTISRAASHGTTEVVGDRIRYQSEGGFTGHDTFGYLVCTTDRRRCVEATVAVNVLPLPFAWRPPVRDHSLNKRSPGHGVLIRFEMPAGKTAVTAVTSVAVDCRSGILLGAHEPVEAQLHANPRRGLIWFRWSTTPTWTGCRNLEVALADGKIHTAHFRWRTGH
jgi:CubicO group peptidase (beta-lactamase class C family)